MRRLKLLAYLPHPDDATSFYRGIGPLADLRERFPIDVTFLTQNQLEEPTIRMYDIIFFQRPAKHWQMQAISIAKDLDKIVWIDWDDDIFTIPNDNPARLFYLNPQNQEVCKQCFKDADILTVSTESLKDAYKEYNENTFVVPNALPKDKTKGVQFFKERNKFVIWRGLSSHDRDLNVYGEKIVSALKSRPEWKIIFIGMNPWRICEQLPGQAEFKATASISTFFKTLIAMKAAIGIVPLADNVFNKSKSNIALLEMGLSGAACVVPNWREWRMPGVMAYNDPEGFGQSLEYLMDHEEDRERNARMIQACVSEKFKLSDANNIRWHILKQIVFQVMPEVTSSHPIYELTEKVSPLSLLNVWPIASKVEFQPSG